MPVEKPLKTHIERSPFTIVYNKVINEIDNMEAFAVWVYLLSKSQEWKTIKEHLKNRFKIGDDKIKKIFAYLNAHGLIEYRRYRHKDGRLGEVEIWILDGSQWSMMPNKNKVKIIEIEKDTTGVKTTSSGNQASGSGALLKKDSYEKKEKTQQEVVVSSFDYNLVETDDTKMVDEFINNLISNEIKNE